MGMLGIGVMGAMLAIGVMGVMGAKTLLFLRNLDSSDIYPGCSLMMMHSVNNLEHHQESNTLGGVQTGE